MPLPFEDLDDFFDTAEFAVEAVFTPSVGPVATIKVIYDNNFEVVNMETGEIESAGPRAMVKSSDVTGVAHGDTLLVNSTTYFIRGIEDDGTGFNSLMLSKY